MRDKAAHRMQQCGACCGVTRDAGGYGCSQRVKGLSEGEQVGEVEDREEREVGGLFAAADCGGGGGGGG